MYAEPGWAETTDAAVEMAALETGEAAEMAAEAAERTVALESAEAAETAPEATAVERTVALETGEEYLRSVDLSLLRRWPLFSSWLSTRLNKSPLP